MARHRSAYATDDNYNRLTCECACDCDNWALEDCYTYGYDSDYSGAIYNHFCRRCYDALNYEPGSAYYERHFGHCDWYDGGYY